MARHHGEHRGTAFRTAAFPTGVGTSRTGVALISVLAIMTIFAVVATSFVIGSRVEETAIFVMTQRTKVGDVASAAGSIAAADIHAFETLSLINALIDIGECVVPTSSIVF